VAASPSSTATHLLFYIFHRGQMKAMVILWGRNRKFKVAVSFFQLSLLKRTLVAAFLQSLSHAYVPN
jgi:hypothetical protein